MKKFTLIDTYREFNIYKKEDTDIWAVAPKKLPLLKIKKCLTTKLECMALIDTCYLRAEEKKGSR